MTAFAAIIEILVADPNIGGEAIYTSDGGVPALVRIVARRADAVTEFGDARLWSETTRIDLRVADVPNPRPGDYFRVHLSIRRRRKYMGFQNMISVCPCRHLPFSLFQLSLLFSLISYLAPSELG